MKVSDVRAVGAKGDTIALDTAAINAATGASAKTFVLMASPG